MNMTDISNVFYSQATCTTVDVVRPDGRGLYSGETIDALRIRYADIETISLDEAVERTDAAFRRPPAKITRERYWEMLEVLPPVAWHGVGSNEETFKLSERTCGSITAIFCRIGENYWEMQDNITLPHKEIVARVRAVAAAATAAAAAAAAADPMATYVPWSLNRSPLGPKG